MVNNNIIYILHYIIFHKLFEKIGSKVFIVEDGISGLGRLFIFVEYWAVYLPVPPADTILISVHIFFSNEQTY
jgi:hypothetical protein